MRLRAILSILLAAPLLVGREPADETANVNSRYRIESVELGEPLQKKRLSRSLRADLDGLIGRQFDPEIVSDLATRIHREVHLVVSHRVERGLQPEHVRVVYTSRPRRWDEDDARVTKLAYHQKQGWTGGVELGFDAGSNRFEFGVGSDADLLIERFAGFNAGYIRRFGERARFRFDFDATHQQWNRATLEALDARPDLPGIYRERFSMQPTFAVEVVPGLSVGAGIGITHVQTQFPAATFQAANAAIATVRHRRRWGSATSGVGHEEDAGYTLRAATNVLGSDFVYARHSFDAGYTLSSGRHHATVRGSFGVIGGRAPLFERFSVGDTRTLRGWNKFDVAPLGGNRMAHTTVGYRYRAVGFFYDAGSVWDNTENADVRHSVGVTLACGALRDGPFLTVAFPLRNGAFVPLFMMGMYF
jgi:hypothetical protein